MRSSKGEEEEEEEKAEPLNRVRVNPHAWFHVCGFQVAPSIYLLFIPVSRAAFARRVSGASLYSLIGGFAFSPFLPFFQLLMPSSRRATPNEIISETLFDPPPFESKFQLAKNHPSLWEQIILGEEGGSRFAKNLKGDRTRILVVGFDRNSSRSRSPLLSL